MQGAIRSMSRSTRQASSMGTGTVNEFSSCTADLLGGASRPVHPRGGPAGTDGYGTVWPVQGTAPSVQGVGRTGSSLTLQPGGGRHRPAGEDRRQMLAVVRLGVEVAAGAGALGRVLGRRRDRLPRGLGAGPCRPDPPRPPPRPAPACP